MLLQKVVLKGLHLVSGNLCQGTDLSELGRDLRDVIIIDNSLAAYAFQPENVLPSISWYGDRQDT